MAVKRVDSNEEKEVVVATPVEEQKNENVVEENTDIEVDNSLVEDNEGISVDPTTFEVNEEPVLEGNVKIRMRVDHRCNIAGVLYDLKKDKTYTVTPNVKGILNKAGYLSPLV